MIWSVGQKGGGQLQGDMGGGGRRVEGSYRVIWGGRAEGWRAVTG